MRLGRESVILIAVPLLLLAGAFALFMPSNGRDEDGVRTDLTSGVSLTASHGAVGAAVVEPVGGDAGSAASSQREVSGPSGAPRAAALRPAPRAATARGRSRDRADYPRRSPFRGRVVDSDGQPVDDPVIIVNERRNVFSDAGVPFHAPVCEVVSVAADGSFEVPRREGHVYVIHVQAQGHARETVNLYATNSGLVTLTMAATVEGLVTDLLTNEQVSGATVLLQMGITTRPLTATTGARGGYRFTGVQSGSGYLEVSHPQYKSRRLQLRSITPGLVVHKAVGLTPGGRLDGTVVIGTSENAPSVPVSVSAYDRFRMQSAGVVSATAQGTFSFESLYPGGQYILTATAPGYGAATATVNLPMSGPAGHPVLVLDEEWTLEGVVSDGFGAPLRGCQIEVAVLTPTAEDPFVVHTNELGGFQIEGLGAHAYRLIASHPEYALDEIWPITRQLHENGVVITLQPGGTVTADVRDPAGNPVMAALARLTVTDNNGRLIGPRLFGYTTSAGTLRMDHVPPGNVSLRIFAAGFVPHCEQFLLPCEGVVVHRQITLLLE